MQELCRTLFTQPWYQLEYLVSSTSYNTDFAMNVGDAVGHLTLEAKNQENATFRYVAPGYHFRFFFRVQKEALQLGFVDYTDSDLEEWGSRVYVPMLLKGLVQRV
jgi:hypothetical protein